MPEESGPRMVPQGPSRERTRAGTWLSRGATRGPRDQEDPMEGVCDPLQAQGPGGRRGVGA